MGELNTEDIGVWSPNTLSEGCTCCDRMLFPDSERRLVVSSISTNSLLIFIINSAHWKTEHSPKRQLEQNRIFLLRISPKVCESEGGLLHALGGVHACIHTLCHVSWQHTGEAGRVPRSILKEPLSKHNKILFFISWSYSCLQAHAINTAARDIKAPLSM